MDDRILDVYILVCLNSRNSHNSYLTQSTHGTRRVNISLRKLHQDVEHFILILQGILERGKHVNEKLCNKLCKESGLVYMYVHAEKCIHDQYTQTESSNRRTF